MVTPFYLKGVHTRLTQISGEWSGTIGNSIFRVNNADFIVATGGKGVRFKGNFPDFSEWMHALIPTGGGPPRKAQFDIDFSTSAGFATTRRNQDFAVANEKFAREFLGEIHMSGPKKGQGIVARAEEYQRGFHPQNVGGTKLTWHHHENMTTMMLVPTDIHGPVGHTGGRGLLDFMLGLE